MKYAVVYEKSPDGYGAYVPDLPGCVAVGDSLEETKRLIHEAIELHLSGMRDDGENIPAPTSMTDSITASSTVPITVEVDARENEILQFAAEIMRRPVSSLIAEAGIDRAYEVIRNYNREVSGNQNLKKEA